MKKKFIIGALGIVILILLAMSGNIAYRIHLMQKVNPEGQYFDSDGVKIHYTVTGQGTPVILVHGLAVNAGMNFGARGLPAELEKTYQVITLDNRGHGRSDKPHVPDAYGTEMCEDIIRLMDHLNIGKAHVLGCNISSWAGSLF